MVVLENRTLGTCITDSLTGWLGSKYARTGALLQTYLPECGESAEKKFDINILQTPPISDTKLHQMTKKTHIYSS